MILNQYWFVNLCNNIFMLFCFIVYYCDECDFIQSDVYCCFSIFKNIVVSYFILAFSLYIHSF